MLEHTFEPLVEMLSKYPPNIFGARLVRPAQVVMAAHAAKHAAGGMQQDMQPAACGRACMRQGM